MLALNAIPSPNSEASHDGATEVAPEKEQLITDSETKGTGKDESTTLLITLNVLAIMAHLVTSVVITVRSINNEEAVFPVYSQALTWKNTTFAMVPNILDEIQPALNTASFNLGFLLMLFSLVSCCGQVASLVMITCYKETHLESFLQGKNPVRWIEYMLSAPVMIWAIAYFTGIVMARDLLFLCLLTAITMITGLFTEQFITAGQQSLAVSVHLVGWVLQFYVWLCIGWQFVSIAVQEEDMPDFVPIIVATEAVLFLSFGVVQLTWLIGQIDPCPRKVCPCKVCIRKVCPCKCCGKLKFEVVYAVLSLTSKLFLTWMLFSSVIAR